MTQNSGNYSYSPIIDYNYAQFFQKIEFNGKTLNDHERKEFIGIIDETIDQFTSGLPMLNDELESTKDLNDDYHRITRVIFSVAMFVAMTLSDCMVASKYFLLAEKDYDKRFLRGKMKIILNEGFKRLYGFKDHKKSEWFRLKDCMNSFPDFIKKQYQIVTDLLEKESTTSTWWKNERDYETHIETPHLYLSRMEKIDESKVMIESSSLFDALLAVNHFLSNANGILLNTLIDRYHRGEIRDE